MVHDQVVRYAADVTGHIAPTGHWVAEEDPAYLTARLLTFLTDDHATPGVHNVMATDLTADADAVTLRVTASPAASADAAGGADA